MLNHPLRPLFLLGSVCVLLAGSAPAFTQDQKEVFVAKVDPDGVQRVRIEGGSYFFKPAHIVVKVNVPVELLASREAGIAIEEDLASDAKKISFTATAVGKYPFYCSKKLLFFASHRERGMEGVLEVVP